MRATAIDLIGVPLDFGAGRRGVDMGPSAIRYAGLRKGLNALGCPVAGHGDIPVPIFDNCQVGDPRLRYVDCIVPVARRVMDFVAESAGARHFPLVLGGDHSIALGAVRGAASVNRIGVIWIDAHADFNTPETTPSGNVHGMPLAAIVGLGDKRLTSLNGEAHRAVDPGNIVVIGARDLDPGEKENLREAGVTVLTMAYIDRYGMSATMERAIEIAAKGTEGIYLSLDMDALDPLYAPGVGTPVQGGLTYREAHLACEMIAESGLLLGMDIVEVNPILDDRNKTAKLSVELILSALGKRIL